MKVVKLFEDGCNQAILLPKDFRFQGDQVYLKKVGSMLIVYPAKNSWELLFEGVTMFSDDFMQTREQPKQQIRMGL